MKEPTQVITASLDNAAIDDFSNRVQQFLTGLKLPRREVVRYAMTVEEILLDTREHGDPVEGVRLRMGTRFRRPFFSLEVIGAANNVFLSRNSAQGVLGESVLKNLGISPEYAYTDGANLYEFRIHTKKIGSFTALILAALLSLGVGALGLLLPDAVRASLLESVIDPLHGVFLNVLGCIAGPMVFLSVAWGIYGIGDAATLKQIGKKLMGSYVGIVAITSLLFGALCVPLFALHYAGNSGDWSAFSSIFAMFLDILPQNIFSPFVNGNTLQIIFLAVVIGIAMLILGRKTNAVAMAVEQINYIVQLLIEFVSKLIPYFIFLVLLKLIWSDMLQIIFGMGRLLLIGAGAIFGAALCVVCFTAVHNRISPLRLIRKGMPTFLIGITTASSAASFGSNTRICQKELGVDSSITAFGLPLGIVMFKPATSLWLVIVGLFGAEAYGIEISFPWLVLMLLSAVMLSLATAPVPGGAIATYTVFLMQLGLPTEYLALVLTCDALIDFVTTATDQFLIPLVLLNQAGKIGMVDRSVLHHSTDKKGEEK